MTGFLGCCCCFVYIVVKVVFYPPALFYRVPLAASAAAGFTILITVGVWASQSIARSPFRFGLLSDSCSSNRELCLELQIPDYSGHPCSLLTVPANSACSGLAP